jgi:hypothetical protein
MTHTRAPGAGRRAPGAGRRALGAGEREREAPGWGAEGGGHSLAA